MERAFLDGGPGWEVAVSFTDEMDEFGVSVELPLDLLLILPGEAPEMLTATEPWEVTVGSQPMEEQPLPRKPPLHPAYKQMDKHTKMVKPSLFLISEHRNARETHLAQSQPGLSPVQGHCQGRASPQRGGRCQSRGDSEYQL